MRLFDLLVRSNDFLNLSRKDDFYERILGFYRKIGYRYAFYALKINEQVSKCVLEIKTSGYRIKIP